MRFGLRERVVAILALVSALTLAVAAIALFSPLDHRLRNATRESLTRTVAGEIGTFTSLHESDFVPGNARLLKATRPLRRTGADVAVFDSSARLLVSTDPDANEPYAAVRTALRTGKRADLITGEGSEAEAHSAVPAHVGDTHFVIAARRPLDDVQGATGVVRRAFLLAALAGLLVAVGAGVLIAGRTARRIRRLRDTAERVAHVGPVAEFRPESGRDEIGDLSRTFAYMQTQLREQEQARRAFVATASHELRTPIASLQIMLDLLISDLDDEPLDVDDARRQAYSADEQAGRLSQLANELLDLSRIDAGVPVRREPVDVAEVLRSVAAEFDVRAADQERVLHVAEQGGDWALADPGHVAGITRILLDNALRHTPRGTAIDTTVQREGDRLGIAVTDAGPGVAESDRDRIFERFARGAEATTGGFGLGLAIARELARRMGGDLVLDTHAPGARFVLWLEAADAP
ncbi:sensor histidine kinase [Solirubrobacter soli]|uniref:sensor histidine kinase n=1 Tax=Solirubrobacter soli TaxID=363832 RepID=UPI000418F4FE|nr:HAMP domain-containing sensor histidine kinase [Solirubrobacter soli]